VAAASGTYTKKFIATATTNLAITPTNTARFTVDNISIKQLTGGGISAGNHYGSIYQATRTALGTTTAPGVILNNPTPATASVLQASPSVLRTGQGFFSNSSTSYSFEVQDYAIGMVNTSAHGKYNMQWRGNNGTWANFYQFDSDPV